jgi:hypothetical protein
MPAQTMTSDRAAPAVVRGNLRDPVPAGAAQGSTARRGLMRQDQGSPFPAPVDPL